MENRDNRIKGGTVLAVVLCIAVGILACLGGALQEQFFGRTVISAPILALLACMTARNFLPALEKEPFRSGANFCGRTVLEIAVALLGGTLSLTALQGIGARALPLVITNLVLVFAAAVLIGKYMGVSENTAVMAAGSSGTCGFFGAAALGRTVKARESELAFVIVSAALFDLLASFILPHVVYELQLTSNQFAYIAGLSVGTVGTAANAQAVYLELTNAAAFQGVVQIKTLCASLLAAAIPGWVMYKNHRQKARSSRRSSQEKLSLPWFFLGFLLLLVLNTAGLFGQTVLTGLQMLTDVLFAIALAGIGFRVKLRSIYTRGMQPMAVCAITWVLTLALSLAFAILFAGYVG